MFQFAELTEVMRQRGDTKFIELLKKMKMFKNRLEKGL